MAGRFKSKNYIINYFIIIYCFNIFLQNIELYVGKLYFLYDLKEIVQIYR
jgi:hypothetical protein